jgi:hypothetical protein
MFWIGLAVGFVAGVIVAARFLSRAFEEEIGRIFGR